jgi:hypothetical protein
VNRYLRVDIREAINDYRFPALKDHKKKLPVGAAYVQLLLGSLPVYLPDLTALTRGVFSIMRIIMEAIINTIIRVKSSVAFILGIVYGMGGGFVKWGYNQVIRFLRKRD